MWLWASLHLLENAYHLETPAPYRISMLMSACPVCLRATVFEDNYSSDCTHNTSAVLFTAQGHNATQGERDAWWIRILQGSRPHETVTDSAFQKRRNGLAFFSPNSFKHVAMVENRMKNVSRWREGGKWLVSQVYLSFFFPCFALKE